MQRMATKPPDDHGAWSPTLCTAMFWGTWATEPTVVSSSLEPFNWSPHFNACATAFCSPPRDQSSLRNINQSLFSLLKSLDCLLIVLEKKSPQSKSYFWISLWPLPGCVPKLWGLPSVLQTHQTLSHFSTLYKAGTASPEHHLLLHLTSHFPIPPPVSFLLADSLIHTRHSNVALNVTSQRGLLWTWNLNLVLLIIISYTSYGTDHRFSLYCVFCIFNAFLSYNPDGFMTIYLSILFAGGPVYSRCPITLLLHEWKKKEV